jgi:hypothetical protein
MKYRIAYIVYRSLTPFAKSETGPRKVTASLTSLNVSQAFDHPGLHRALTQGLVLQSNSGNVLPFDVPLKNECLLIEAIPGTQLFYLDPERYSEA